jgi:hypothetical protein
MIYKYKYSVLTSRKEHVFVTKLNWLMLFREIIVVYSENHRKSINTDCGRAKLLIVKADGT